MIPLIEETPYLEPDYIAQHFSSKPGTLLLHSSAVCPSLGRYSFLALDPFQIFQGNFPNNPPMPAIESALSKFQFEHIDELPPFQGGVAGFMGYECHQYFESLSQPTPQASLQFPDYYWGVYDLVLSFDHVQQRAWICSSGFPEKNQYARQQRSKQRLKWLKNLLEQLPQSHTKLAAPQLALTSQALIDSLGTLLKLKSNFSSESYQAAVRKTQEYILAGDIFEANISQRFLCKRPQNNFSPFQLYEISKLLNPATFSGYLCMGEQTIISASPERFIQATGKQLETRPIKGTRPRGQTPEIDAQLASELCNSAKDNAENVMIVDLMRNDFSKICEDNSVTVPTLCGLESYASVHHLVSVVEGRLKSKCNLANILPATFPAGSISGAPKIRAMEIIAEIEGVARGPYCGNMGYFGFNGTMDTSVLIRSFTIDKTHMSFHAGGAVTIDSCPEEEYQESLTKAHALLKTLYATILTNNTTF